MHALLILCLAVTVVGCETKESADPACAGLDGSRFLGPTDEWGTCSCGLADEWPRVASFEAGQLTHQEFDMERLGPYTCSAGIIHWSGGPVIGTYNVDQGSVTIANATYTQCNGPACSVDRDECWERCPAACDAIVGKTYRATSPDECGLCPPKVGGTYSCLWVLGFDADRLDMWRSYSDLGYEGSYICSEADGEIIIEAANGFDNQSGTYDPARDEIHWESKVYEACDPPCDQHYSGCLSP